MIWVPDSVERVVPSWFARELRALDPNLIPYFNSQRQRWIIDRCTLGGALNAAMHEHTPECPKTNVMVVQDEGHYMPLCERVLDELRSKDSWSQYGSFENYQRHTANEDAADEAKRERQIDNLYHDASADHRRQLLQAYHLTQQHDTARINK